MDAQGREVDAKLESLNSRLVAVQLPLSELDEGVKAVRDEVARLLSHSRQASTTNIELQRLLAEHSQHLHSLSLPFNAFLQLFKTRPSVAARKDNSSPQVEVLKKLCSKVEEMKQQRQDLYKSLTEDLKNDDLASELLLQKGKDPKELFESSIKKHDKLMKYLEQNLGAQEKIIAALLEANADVAEERKAMQLEINDRRTRVVGLVAAADVYFQVTKKVEEARHFYSKLASRADKLEVAVEGIETAFNDMMKEKNAMASATQAKALEEKREQETKATMNEFSLPNNDLPPPNFNPASSSTSLSSVKSRSSRGDYMEMFLRKMAEKAGLDYYNPSSRQDYGNSVPLPPTLPTLPPLQGISKNYTHPPTPSLPSPSPSTVSNSSFGTPYMGENSPANIVPVYYPNSQPAHYHLSIPTGHFSQGFGSQPGIPQPSQVSGPPSSMHHLTQVQGQATGSPSFQQIPVFQSGFSSQMGGQHPRVASQIPPQSYAAPQYIPTSSMATHQNGGNWPVSQNIFPPNNQSDLPQTALNQEVPQWQNQGAPRHSSASYQNAVAVSSQSSVAAPPARPLTASSQAIPSMALPPFYSQSFNTWQPSQMPAAPLPSSTSNTVPFSSYQPHSQHSAPPVCTVTQTSPSAPSSGVQPSNNQGNQAFQGGGGLPSLSELSSMLNSSSLSSNPPLPASAALSPWHRPATVGLLPSSEPKLPAAHPISYSQQMNGHTATPNSQLPPQAQAGNGYVYQSPPNVPGNVPPFSMSSHEMYNIPSAQQLPISTMENNEKLDLLSSLFPCDGGPAPLQPSGAHSVLHLQQAPPGLC